MSARLRTFALGVSAPWHGIRLLLSSTGLAKWALAPAAVFVIAFGLGLAWVYATNFKIFYYLGASSFLQHLPGGFWATLAVILAWPVLLVAIAFVSLIVAKILAGPFNSVLAARALAGLGAPPLESLGKTGAFLRAASLFRSALGSITQEAILLSCGVVLFIAAWIPVLNLVAMAAYFFLIAVDCMSYSLEGLGYGFRARLHLTRGSSLSLIGFAASLAVILFIPIVGFFAYPIGVVGAAWLVSKLGYAAREP